MSKFILNSIKLLFVFGLVFSFNACSDDDDPIIDPGTGTVNVADGFYISLDNVNPVSSQILKAESVENDGFTSQARTGFVANYIYLEAGNYKISEVASKEFKTKVGGTIEKKTDAGSGCNFNDYFVVKTSASGSAFNVATAGLYKVTYDALTNESVLYEIKNAGIIGDATPAGWSGDTDLPLSGTITKDGAAWQGKGITMRQGAWKVRFNCRWSLDRRTVTTDFKPESGYQMFTNFGGTVADLKTGNDSGNIPVTAETEGIYTIDLKWTPKDGFKASITKTGEVAVVTFDPTKYNFGLVGDATAKGWDADRNFYYKKDGTTHKWIGVFTLVADKFFKFRTNDTWDFNLGGDIANLSKGGDNIKATESGAHYIVISTTDEGKTWKATVEKKSWGVIGAGSPSGNWDNDTVLTAQDFVDGIESYTMTGDFSTGEWKFRAGGAWDLNLGGTALTTLTVDGPNLKMSEAGKYKLTLTYDGAIWASKAEKQ